MTLSRRGQVVYNSTFGGFSLSRLAAIWLAGKGHEDAVRWLAEAENANDWAYNSYYPDKLQRHDPLLIACVEALGSKAAGELAELSIHSLRGQKYRIESYDGKEDVVEPDDLVWVDIDKR